MNSEILEKLKKLLRLGQSSNRHEAELAIARAFELAARHSIDLESIDLDEETKRILHKAFKIGERFSLIRKLTLNIIEMYFNVEVIMARPNLVFVGTETDVEIAIYIHEFLVGACSRALRRFAKENRRQLSPRKRNGFIAGFMYGISSKLSGAKQHLAIEESKTALTVRNKAKRADYIAANFKIEPVAIDVGKRNYDAVMTGYRNGKDVEINKGVSGAKPAPLLLSI